ncbi:McrB family protein [Streptomyces triticiradicis]|uniref:AAA domain-containing protein n=1 Tax=Streptomyces triticiradicis TaxID=2651189 RepID=A0A7J5D6U3_9ACTN|nr:AAA family ATPase [Streptomyces triticiradicis]KAB1980803.1 AAA domain-containing protein [Streptomyces triticiradicis]
MTNGVDVRTAAVEFDRRGVADVESAAEDERKQVLSQFPLEAWAELPLERYALGQTTSPGSGPTYCRLLEFLTPNLGSIKGGSAAKHIMYHHVSGEWRLAAPLRGMEPQEAWVHLRGQFVQAFDAVAAGDFDALDDLEVLRYGPTLVTKTLATYFPEHFLPIYAGEHLRRFVALLLGGSVQGDAPAWRSNRRLLELVRDSTVFEGWTRYEVMHFLYQHADPRPRQRTIWKIAPGERGRLWDECRTDGVIRVGWEQVGDLGLYQSDTDLKQALDAHWPGKSGGSLTLARRLLAFRDLEEGDRIVANRGVDEVLATGTVSGNYRFEADRQEFQHTVPVDWDLSHAQRLPEPRQWRSTFARVDPAFFAKLTAHRADSDSDSDSDAGTTAQEPQTAPIPLPEDVQTVLDALKRKGQVILYGPPGTGKTRLALSAALALDGRAEALDANAAQRAEAQAEMLHGDRVRMVTFHPSYGYEDFVEGFKPDLSAKGPGLTLELTDGLFHNLCSTAADHPEQNFLLVIDEINRGDLPRIFGELITLLELDKRNLPVALPVSKRRFAVPPNVRIIGTMNTADRSISHLDAAVRRRFAFLPVGPDPDAVSGTVGPLDLAAFFEALNTRITRHLDADHQIGHAYLLCDGAPIATDEDLAAAFHHEVIPLLEDYCVGRAELLHRILGGLVDADTGRPLLMSPQDLADALASEFTSGVTGADA